MARKISFKRDRKLSLRMYLTMFGIGLLYAALGVAMWQFGLGWYYIIPIILLFSVLQIWFSDRIILGASGAKLVTPEQEPRLHALVDKLVERAQLPKPKVAVINSAALNAFATGKSPKSALVAVTKGLMQLLNEEELEGVLAHELGHIKQRDILVVGIANFLVAVTSFLSTVLFWNLLFGGGRNRDNGSAPIFLLYLVVLLVYFVGQMLVLALTRYREYLADHSGAELSGQPRALASALAKIHNLNLKVPREQTARLQPASALCISPMVPKNDLANAFSTHPPVRKRIDRLLALEKSGTIDYKYSFRGTGKRGSSKTEKDYRYKWDKK